ncbi:MAG: hypothetical protein H0V12_00065 [Chloroflexi bacterium]|nr:hypothetical protein [Chloroflexota bacterium]
MRLRTLLRTNAGAWLAVPMVLLAVLTSATFRPASSDGYGIALIAAGTSALAFVAPLCAAAGAWEGGRLRRAEWWAGPHARSRVTIAAWAVGPAIVAGSLAVGAAVVAKMIGAGVWAVDVRLLALSVLVLTAHALAGFSLGLWVPLTIAAPTALISSYLWLAFPRALNPLWVRHLNGSLDSCCQLHQDLAPAAFWAAAAMALGMIAAAAWALMRAHWSRRALAGTAAPVVLGVTLGSVLVAGMGSDPVVARDPSLLVCSRGTAPTVCVWPEHRGRLDEVVLIARRASEGWRGVGLAVPGTFSEIDPVAAPPGVGSFGFSLEADADDIRNALSYAMLPPFPACTETEPFRGNEARDYVLAWFDATGGMSDEGLTERFADSSRPGAPPTLDTVRDVRAQPPTTQREWVERNVAALGVCDLEPQLLPDA